MQPIPGPRYPRPWQTYQWLRHPTELLTACRARYGEVFQLRCYGDGDMVVLAHPGRFARSLRRGMTRFISPKTRSLLACWACLAVCCRGAAFIKAMRRAILPALGQAQVKRHIDALAAGSGGVWLAEPRLL